MIEDIFDKVTAILKKQSEMENQLGNMQSENNTTTQKVDTV